MLCENCKAKIPTVETRARRVNRELQVAGLNYYDTIGETTQVLRDTLTRNGFSVELFCFDDVDTNRYKVHFDAGDRLWLTASIYRMASGRYELTAYLS